MCCPADDMTVREHVAIYQGMISSACAYDRGHLLIKAPIGVNVSVAMLGFEPDIKHGGRASEHKPLASTMVPSGTPLTWCTC
jgi:hypothetical protein